MHGVQAGSLRRILICLIALVVGLAPGYAQTLGDVAREQRQKQQSKDGHATAKKVVTDEDIAAHREPEPEAKPSEEKKEPQSPEKPGKGGPTAEQWKARIAAQKTLVADMQKQADRLEASIHFVDSGAYWNGPQYNQVQVRKQEKLRELQQRIEEQKTKLEDMQESARRAGFGNAVYDPE
jgi:hypothetical protein